MEKNPKQIIYSTSQNVWKEISVSLYQGDVDSSKLKYVK